MQQHLYTFFFRIISILSFYFAPFSNSTEQETNPIASALAQQVRNKYLGEKTRAGQN